jgi:hypothetical protein
MTQEPQVNDYVIWENGKEIEGWVYFKNSQYITIELAVRHKGSEGHPEHQKYHSLVLCYRQSWKELKYVKKRQSVHEKEKNNLENLGEIIG